MSRDLLTGVAWPRVSWRRAALALLLAFCASSGLDAQTTRRDTLPIVRNLEIAGNQTFDDDSIKRAIATRASGCKSVLLLPFCWLEFDAFRRTERLDPRELRTDVARIRVFYYRRGFRWTQVDTLLERDSIFVDLTFRVDEGPAVRVRELSIEGLDDVEEREAILRGLPLREGEPFSELAVAASRDQIEKRLGDRGYPRAAVLLDAMIPRPDTLSAEVTLRVEPGPRARIGEIAIQGASELTEGDVKRMLTFKAGELYDESEIIRSQRQLYSMALFNYVDIQTELDEADSLMQVSVRINEARMRGVQLGFGVSNTDCFQVQAGWAHRNLFGGTRRLELTASLSNMGTQWLAQNFPCNLAGTRSEELENVYNRLNWRLRADFRQPWFLGTQNSLDMGLFFERQSLPPIYARRGYGGDVRLSREISEGTSIAATYRAGQEGVIEGSADFLFCANFGVCDPEDIDRLGEPRWLNWITFSFARSRTDAVLSPTRGYRLALEAETASRLTRSGWAYYRAQGELSWYQSLFGGSVLGLRLRGGFLRPLGSGLEGSVDSSQEEITPPVKRHYAGGAYTVRGFAQNLLGPKVLLADSSALAADMSGTDPRPGCDPSGIEKEFNRWTCDGLSQFGFSSGVFSPRPIGGENSFVVNAELRVPLGHETWTGVAFVDFGRVWTKDKGPTWRQVWTPGVGIRYRSPVGPLRLDVGYNPSPPEDAPVVAQLESEERTLLEVVQSDGSPSLFRYDPFEGGGLGEFFNRLQLHFSIGQAF